MTTALRVLMLLTDGFGGVGGIAKFNRDFLQALDACRIGGAGASLAAPYSRAD